MGTPSLTVLMDEGEELAVLYRHMDGYPSEHGRALAQFLLDAEVTQGIRDLEGKEFNGGGDLAVRLICALKDQGAEKGWNWPGMFYLCRAGTREMYAPYVYYVAAAVGHPVEITVVDLMGPIQVKLFSGSASELLAWIEAEKAKEE